MLTSVVLKWVLLGGVAGLALGFMLGFALANELWRHTLETKDAVMPVWRGNSRRRTGHDGK